jgi:hypothetical protein
MMEVNFPDHFVPETEKDRQWHLDFAMAAWKEWDSSGVRCFQRGTLASDGHDLLNYEDIDRYMDGNQSVARYYPMMGIDESSDETYMNIDFKIFPIMPKQERVVNGIMDKLAYKVGFVPLDAMAVDRKNKYFSNIRARIEMRELILSQEPENGPAIIKQFGLDKLAEEPGDAEELEIQAMYSYKDVVATEWTKDVAAVLSMNKVEQLRKKVRKSVFRYGVGGYKDYIDTNGAIRVRSVNVKNLILSHCLEADFSDARYIGEVLSMSLADFAQANQDIPIDDLLIIANKVKGLFGNPGEVVGWETARRFKINVLDLEFWTVNTQNYEVGETKYGNMAVVRQPLAKSGEKFIRSRVKMVHGVKWVVGTDVVFDFGPVTDIKRAKEQVSEIVMNYHLYAPSMSNMVIQSIGRSVQPILDQAQVAWLRLQKTIGEYRSKGISINFDSLDNISYGRGGKAMKESDIVELFLQGNIHLYRQSTRAMDGKMFNKPIEIVEGTGMDDVLAWFNALQQYVQMLKDAIGLNEFTDASTPDARALGKTVNTAVMATNNSLSDIVYSDVHLLSKLSESIVLRLQDMAGMGLSERYARSIGDNSVNFLEKNPRVSPGDWAIEVRPLPTAEERQQLVSDLKALLGNDLISFEDLVLVETSDDLQTAKHILGWRIKKRKEQKLQESLMLQEQNANVQAQSGIAVEQERQKTVSVEGEIKIKVAQIQASAAIKVAEIQAGASMSNKMVDRDAAMEEKNEEAMAA